MGTLLPWGVWPSHPSESAAVIWNANETIALDDYFTVFYLAFLSCLATVPTSIFFFFSSYPSLM